MALSANQVQQFYIGYYGRPADPVGLAYWQTQDEAAALAGFSGSAEFTNQFTGLSVTQQVTKVYMNLLGRAPDAAGLLYWAGELTAGRETIGSLVMSMTENALGKDVTTIENRVEYSNAFTAALDTTEEINAYNGPAATQAARAALLKVVANSVGDTTALDAELAKIDDTIAAIVGGGTDNPGETFVLTAGIDNIVGTSGNDTIIGDKTSTNPADQIDGGAGYDTVKLTGFGDGAFTDLPQMKNVEQLTLVGNKAAAVDVSAVTGLQNVTLENNPTVNVAVSGLSSATSLGLTNVSDNAKTIGGTLGATDTSATLVVSGSKDAGAVTFTGAKIDTVKVNSTGAAANTLANLVVAGGGALKNLTISGDQALTVTAPLANTVAKIDASASTGGFTLETAAALAGNLAVTGSAGKDTLTVGTGGTNTATIDLGAGDDVLILGDLDGYDATSVFDGGAGRDAISFADGDKLDSTTAKTIKNFEILELGGGKNTYDVSLLKANNAIDTIQVGTADLGANVTVQNLANNGAVNILVDVTHDLTVNIKDAAAGTADALTVNIGGKAAVTAAKVVAAETETITVNSTSTMTGWSNAVNQNKLTDLEADKMKTLVITGDKSLEVDAAAAANGALQKIDASAFTGNFTMTADTKATSILGGSGNDTLFSAAAGSTINAGKGNDIIDLAASVATKDVIILNAGDAKAVLTAAGVLDAAKLETVTNFTSGQDVLDLGSFGFTAQQKSAWAVKGDLAAVKLDADIANFFVDTGIARGVAYDAANGYLLVDVNQDGNFNAGTDLVIQITGLNFADIGF